MSEMADNPVVERMVRKIADWDEEFRANRRDEFGRPHNDSAFETAFALYVLGRGDLARPRLAHVCAGLVAGGQCLYVRTSQMRKHHYVDLSHNYTLTTGGLMWWFSPLNTERRYGDLAGVGRVTLNDAELGELQTALDRFWSTPCDQPD